MKLMRKKEEIVYRPILILFNPDKSNEGIVLNIKAKALKNEDAAINVARKFVVTEKKFEEILNKIHTIRKKQGEDDLDYSSFNSSNLRIENIKVGVVKCKKRYGIKATDKWKGLFMVTEEYNILLRGRNFTYMST